MKRSLSKSTSDNKKKIKLYSSSKSRFSNIFLDKYSSSFKNISSIAESNKDILSDIKKTDIIDDEDLYINMIFKKFIKIPLEDRINLYHKNTKFKLDLKYYTSKSLIIPETIINILSNNYNLSIDKKLECKDKTFCDCYASNDLIHYLLTFIDIIGLNVLYIINDDFDYISPLNNKYYRNFIRSKGYHNYQNYLEKYKKYTEKTLLLMKKKNIYSDIIDCNNYDLIIKHNSITDLNFTDKLYKISLINLEYNSSLLRNTLFNEYDNENHIISINKCNYNYIINTTWKPFNKYKIDYINLNEKNDYKIIQEKCLKKVIKTRNLNDYYKLYNYSTNKIKKNFYNINIFSSKNNTKIYKNLIGGLCNDNEIDDFDICKNIYFPNNIRSNCWFSSIINVLFNSDNISSIVLNKITRQMDKTINFINKIDYSIIDFDDNLVMNKLNRHFIIFFSYIYTSFFILSKYKINNKITNLKKWKEVFLKIFDEDIYNNIYTFILVLEFKSLENI